MNITDVQKEELRVLIREGKKIKAVRKLQQTYGLTAEQSLTLVEELTKEIDLEPKSKDVLHKEMLDRMRNRTKGADIGKYIGSFFAICGLFMLAGGTYSFVSDSEFVSHAELIEGKCIGYDSYISHSDEGSSTMFTPIFEYEFRGKTYEQLGEVSSSGQDYDINEVVEIYVDPESPTNILVNTFWDRWFLVMILGIMGVMFTGMGLLAVVMSRNAMIAKT